MNNTFFHPTPKHIKARQDTNRYVLEYGAKSTAKTKNRIEWSIAQCVKFMGAVIIIFRGTIGEIKDSIIPEFVSIQNKFPEFWQKTISNFNRTDRVFEFFNGSRILTNQCNRKADPNLSQLTTSNPATAMIPDDCANYLQEDTFNALDFNLGKIQAYDEVRLHKFLNTQNLIKRNLLPEYRHLSDQRKLFNSNREALSQFNNSIQKEVLEQFSMPNQIIFSLNPSNLSYWRTHLYAKAKRKEPNYSFYQYSWRDNIEYLSKSQIEHFEQQEKQGGNWAKIFALGEPVLQSDPLDLFSPSDIDRFYEIGKNVKKSQFYGPDGKLKDNFVILGGLDPAELGPDVSAICAPAYENKSTGDVFVFGFDHSVTGKTDSDYFRDTIPDLLKTLGIKHENFGVDRQGTKVSHFLTKDGCNVTEFRQAKCGTIPLNKGYEFYDLRAEIYWNLVQLGKQDKLHFCFPYHKELNEELLMLRRVHTETGEIKLIKKDQIRKIHGTSTDYPDALAYACAVNKIDGGTGISKITRIKSKRRY